MNRPGFPGRVCAELNGATEAEIEDAVDFAKSSAGWSIYVNGMQLDFDEFKQEVEQACEFVRKQQMQKHPKMAA